ncbi:hypothetical protein SAMN05216558_0854 [Pseudomonas vancouverensis]|nr:hypothetical protein SAMN05216558_0854 [Pseudomonas vancouverensis]
MAAMSQVVVDDAVAESRGWDGDRAGGEGREVVAGKKGADFFHPE